MGRQPYHAAPRARCAPRVLCVEGLVRAVRPDRGEELSRRAGGHPGPAPLPKRLSGFLEVRGLAGSRCSGLVSVPPHLNDSETVASDLFASVVQALDLSQLCGLGCRGHSTSNRSHFVSIRPLRELIERTEAKTASIRSHFTRSSIALPEPQPTQQRATPKLQRHGTTTTKAPAPAHPRRRGHRRRRLLHHVALPARPRESPFSSRHAR